MTSSWRVLLLLAVLLIPPPPATGNARLAMQVSPAVSLEPASVTIRVTVETDSSNRLLVVVAESPEFRRSSEISLDGERAPRLNTFSFKDVPSGVYDVSSTLVAQNGARTTVVRPLIVGSSPGGGRRSPAG